MRQLEIKQLGRRQKSRAFCEVFSEPVVATLGPGEKRVVFILGKMKFIMEEWLEKFEINERETRERLQRKVWNGQVRRARFARDLHEISPHLDVGGTVERRQPRQDLRLIANVRNDCAKGDQAGNGGQEEKPARGEEDHWSQGKPEPSHCHW